MHELAYNMSIIIVLNTCAWHANANVWM